MNLIQADSITFPLSTLNEKVSQEAPAFGLGFLSQLVEPVAVIWRVGIPDHAVPVELNG